MNHRAGLFVLALAGCGDTDPAVIGFAFPDHGVVNVTVAREELAETAAAGDRGIEIVYDSIGMGDPADVEVERASMIAALPHIVAVVGHGGSRGSLAAAPVYNDAHLPQVVPTSTSRLLRDAGSWTLVMAPDDSVEGAFIGRFVTDRFRAERVTIFYVNDEYGSGLRDGVAAALQAHGATVVAVVPVGTDSDVPTLVDAALRRGMPDVVVSAARGPTTAAIVRHLYDRGHLLPVVAGDGVLPLQGLARRMGPGADSLYAVTFWAPGRGDSVSRAFDRRFRRLFPDIEPSGTHAMIHDAIMVTAAAIRAVGTDRSDVRAWLLSLGRSRPPYRGVTGPIVFAGDRSAVLQIVRLRQGRPVPVAWP